MRDHPNGAALERQLPSHARRQPIDALYGVRQKVRIAICESGVEQSGRLFGRAPIFDYRRSPLTMPASPTNGRPEEIVSDWSIQRFLQFLMTMPLCKVSKCA